MSTEQVNGAVDALKAAQERVCAAIMRQPMNPTGAAISAYTNAVLQSARVSVLVSLYLEPPNETFSPKEAYEARLVGELGKIADALEANAASIQVAGAAPPIIARVN